MKRTKTKKASTQKKRKTQTSKSKYRSLFEGKVAAILDNMGVAYEYEGEKIPYYVERNYLTDFKLMDNGIYIETKGYLMSEDQRKYRAVKEQHPEIDLRFVFQKVNGKVQGSQMTCADWCRKYGFQYAEGAVPQEWIDERK